MAIKDIKEITFPKKVKKRIIEKSDESIKKEQPIEILLNLVEENEIDPWDLDIVDVADKFLDKVEILEKKDLAITAKTLYCASILLRKKSDCLIEDEEKEKEPPSQDKWEPAVFNPTKQEPPKLEMPARRKSKRSATIIELMDELKNALEQEKSKKRKRKLKSKKEEKDEEKVKNLAHDEEIEKKVEETYQKIKKGFRKKKEIKFSELIEIKTRSNIIDKFLSILFLANREKVLLIQEEMYGEIKIRPSC
ncbi:segregation/condensation protein A [archaeon SCG-AAA382B04]|nr:segregation/condensation protein A [archaeon SCG-AAA382B04]